MPAGTPASRGSRGRATLFWGISGGTILSVVGFIALCLFEKYNDGLNELNADLKHFNLSCADLVKKEELRNFKTRAWSNIKELHAAAAAARIQEIQVTQLEQQVKAAAQENKELTRELQRLRERLASVEGRQSAPPIIMPVVKTDKPVSPPH
jgi:hypothetical protein